MDNFIAISPILSLPCHSCRQGGSSVSTAAAGMEFELMTMDRRTFTMGMAGAGLAATLIPAQAALAAKSKVSAKPLDVLVLGAGVSGLQAAWMLEQEGLKVTVLEGRQTVGGRVMTLFDEAGYPEMGFNSMGEGYGRGIDAAQRAGVELEDLTSRYKAGAPAMLWLNGQPITREQWAAHPNNPFPDQLKTVLPFEMVNKLIFERTPLEDWNAWTDPASGVLDISMHEYLRAQGLSDAAIRLANDVAPYYGTTSWDISALMVEFNDGFVKAQIAAGHRSFSVKGGNQKLPIGMAKLLKGDVILGKEVVAIDSGSTLSTVYCRDGSTFTAKRVISALPFATLRHIKIMPGLSGIQAEAVSRIAYQPLSNAFITATSPFWEEDGLSAGMWTDGLGANVLPQRFGSDPSQITGFLVQARGNLAHYWDRMPKADALSTIVSHIESIRPATKGKLVGRHFHSWTQETFSGGAWAYFGPGQVTRFANEMAKPAGQLYFCGEHTATGARGLEGAFESAERVAFEVLEA